MTLGNRVAALAATTPPFSPDDFVDGKAPDGFDARVQELGEHLERVGEIDATESVLELVQPFCDELCAGLVDLPDNVVPISSRVASLTAEQLLRRAWTITSREFRANLLDKIGLTARLLYVGVTRGTRRPLPRRVRDELVEDLHQAICHWLSGARAEVLTTAEANELDAMREADGPTPA